MAKQSQVRGDAHQCAGGGRFVGWSLPRGSTLTTAAGVGPGSTWDELIAAHAATRRESTLGTELTAGDLAGLLDSDAPDATVLHLWAGENCIAR